MARKLLRTREVSEITGIPESSLRWMRHVGKGPKSFALSAKHVVYDEADVLAWIEARYAEAERKAAG